MNTINKLQSGDKIICSVNVGKHKIGKIYTVQKDNPCDIMPALSVKTEVGYLYYGSFYNVSKLSIKTLRDKGFSVKVTRPSSRETSLLVMDKNGKTVKASAVASPTDQFCKKIGLNLCLSRIEEKIVELEEGAAPKPKDEYISAWDVKIGQAFQFREGCGPMYIRVANNLLKEGSIVVIGLGDPVFDRLLKPDFKEFKIINFNNK